MTQRGRKEGAATVEEPCGVREATALGRPRLRAPSGAREGGREEQGGRGQGEQEGAGTSPRPQARSPGPCRSPGSAPATLWLESAQKQSFGCRHVSPQHSRAAPRALAHREGRKERE